MPKRTKPFIIRIQAEGTTAEKVAIRNGVRRQAKKLADDMPRDPADKAMYIRELAFKAFRRQLDRDVLAAFLQITGTLKLFEEVCPRVEDITRKERR